MSIKKEKSYLCSKEDCEQRFQELIHLDSIDQKDGIWNDIRWLYFEIDVLYKYKKNKNIEIVKDGCYSFLIFNNYSEEEEKLPVELIPQGKLIMIQAREYVLIPPKERKHWEKFQVKKRDEYPGIWEV